MPRAMLTRSRTRKAAVVRDTLYIDGGDLWWLPGLASGQYDTPVSDGKSNEIRLGRQGALR